MTDETTRTAHARYGLEIYLWSQSTETRLRLDLAHSEEDFVAPFSPSVEEVVARFGLDNAANDWRFMTGEEVVQFIADHQDEDPDYGYRQCGLSHSYEENDT